MAQVVLRPDVPGPPRSGARYLRPRSHASSCEASAGRMWCQPGLGSNYLKSPNTHLSGNALKPARRACRALRAEGAWRTSAPRSWGGSLGRRLSPRITPTTPYPHRATRSKPRIARIARGEVGSWRGTAESHCCSASIPFMPPNSALLAERIKADFPLAGEGSSKTTSVLTKIFALTTKI